LRGSEKEKENWANMKNFDDFLKQKETDEFSTTNMFGEESLDEFNLGAVGQGLAGAASAVGRGITGAAKGIGAGVQKMMGNERADMQQVRAAQMRMGLDKLGVPLTPDVDKKLTMWLSSAPGFDDLIVGILRLGATPGSAARFKQALVRMGQKPQEPVVPGTQPASGQDTALQPTA